MEPVPAFYDTAHDLAQRWRHRSKPKYSKLKDYVHSLRGSKEFKPDQLDSMACIEVTPSTKGMIMFLPLFRSGEFGAPTDKFYHCRDCPDHFGSLEDHLMTKHQMTIQNFLGNREYLQCGYGPCSQTEVYYPDDHINIHKDGMEFREELIDIDYSDLEDGDDSTNDQSGLAAQSNGSQLGAVNWDPQPGPSKLNKVHGFACNECQIVFQKEDWYLSHNNEVHKKGDNTCYYCRKEFPSLEMCIAHTVKFHLTMVRAVHDNDLESRPLPTNLKGKSKSGGLVCDKCPKVVENKERLKKHKKIRHKPRLYECIESECPKEFSDERLLIAHRAQEHQIRGEVPKDIPVVDL